MRVVVVYCTIWIPVSVPVCANSLAHLYLHLCVGVSGSAECLYKRMMHRICVCLCLTGFVFLCLQYSCVQMYPFMDV